MIVNPTRITNAAVCTHVFDTSSSRRPAFDTCRSPFDPRTPWPPDSDGCRDLYQTFRYFSPVTVNNLRTESRKLLGGQDLLDQRENDVLLMPDVRFQAPTQFVQRFGRRRFAG